MNCMYMFDRKLKCSGVILQSMDTITVSYTKLDNGTVVVHYKRELVVITVIIGVGCNWWTVKRSIITTQNIDCSISEDISTCVTQHDVSMVLAYSKGLALVGQIKQYIYTIEEIPSQLTGVLFASAGAPCDYSVYYVGE